MVSAVNSVGYSHIFDACAGIAERGFDDFRDQYDRFHFLLPVGEQRTGPDHEAIGIATLADWILTSAYLCRNKPNLGYAKREDYVPLDMIDSRHLMMSVLIFSKIGRRVRNVVEIGGGWGNWARLNEGIVQWDRWDIIDLPFVAELQRWYLSQTLHNRGKVRVRDADEQHLYSDWPTELVIAAHSLSEFSMDVFDEYLEKEVKKSRYLFYATHLALPHPALVLEKLAKLDALFNRISEVRHCGGQVTNILYERKRDQAAA